MDLALATGQVEEVGGPNGRLMLGYDIFWTRAAARTPRILRARDLILQGFAGSA